MNDNPKFGEILNKKIETFIASWILWLGQTDTPNENVQERLVERPELAVMDEVNVA